MEPFLQGDPRCIEDVRHDMGGSDKVDIMATYALEFQHHVRQVFILNFLSSPLVSNRPVLTEDTAKVTVGKEDGAGSFSAYD